MKKIIFTLVFSLSIFLSTNAYASVAYSQTTTLSPGWNVVSAPRVLESYSFSVPELSSNFDIYTSNPSSLSGWSTMADLSQTSFVPLFGYFINNKTGVNQTLTFNYKANLSPAERVFDRVFGQAGWYVVGVANPQYAKAINAVNTDTNNPSNILYSLNNLFDTVIDATSGLTSTAISQAWASVIPATVNTLNDFRETKAYLIHITGLSHLSGYQDNTIPATSTSILTAQQDPTTIYATSYRINTFSNGAEKALTSTFALKSELGSSKINTVTVMASSSATLPTNLYLYQGATLLDARSVTGTSTIFDISNSNVQIAQDTTLTFTVKADMPTTTATGTLLSTQLKQVAYERTDASTSTLSNLSIPLTPIYHFFAQIVPVLSQISTAPTTVNNGSFDNYMNAVWTLNIQANGGDILVASTTAVIGLRNVSTGAIIATSSVTGVSENGLNYFADGSTKPLQFTKTFASTTFAAGTTNVRVFIDSITYKPAGWSTGLTIRNGLEQFDSSSYASFSK